MPKSSAKLRMKHLLPVFLLLIFFASCFNKTPNEILPKDTIKALLTDIHLVDGYVSTSLGETSQIEGLVLFKSVFTKYHTDSATFAKSLRYYTNRPKELKEIYAAVTTNIDKILKHEQKLSAEEQRRNQLIMRREAEKRKQDSLKQVMLKKEKATRDSIMKLPLKRRKELLELINKKKMEKLREEFAKRQRSERFWKFQLPIPAIKNK